MNRGLTKSNWNQIHYPICVNEFIKGTSTNQMIKPSVRETFPYLQEGSLPDVEERVF